MRVFLDTNILVDVLLNRPAFVADSESLILRCEALGAEMLVAWHGLATADYLLKRGRTEQQATVEVDKILAWARVADCTDASARRARALGFPDFDDALQAVAAEGSAADWLVTRNTSDFARSRVPVLTPSQFRQRFPLPPVS
jgi:predicted nucleic acid-binding protein